MFKNLKMYLFICLLSSLFFPSNVTEPRFPELVELLHVPLQSLYKKSDHNILTENSHSTTQ